jgi:hypothetical protein
MNLVLLLGAAVGSERFSELLFEDPLRAATLLNITLTETELKQLKETFNPERRNELLNHFGAIRLALCRVPPCAAYQVVLPKESGAHGKAA